MVGVWFSEEVLVPDVLAAGRLRGAEEVGCGRRVARAYARGLDGRGLQEGRLLGGVLAEDLAGVPGRDRFDAAERREAAARGALSDGKLTPQERESRLREIFGI